MKIGILETGELSEQIVEKHGTYPGMFVHLLGAADPELTFQTWSVVNGALPLSPQEADGWLITGSRHSIYDDLPWIDPLKRFLKDCLQAKIPVAGICFGHQMLAEAMGGRARKSEKGWGVGVQDYSVTERPTWMSQIGETYQGHAVHQDQVVLQPPETTVLATSQFCEYAALAYGDKEAPLAISVQSHPEISEALMADLIEARLRGLVPDELADEGLASLSGPLDNANWAHAIARFFRHSQTVE